MGRSEVMCSVLEQQWEGQRSCVVEQPHSGKVRGHV